MGVRAVPRIAHPTVEQRKARGVESRQRTPVSDHGGWRAAADRPDPVALLEGQNLTREPDLVPVRHGRMMISPFTFYRGAAKIMAADLKDTPVAGLGAQLCGDAHLSNFGAFASPERRLLFDLNDFDETLPGPFEYDVKRMAASFTIAARNNGFSKEDTRTAALASVRAYREAMATFAQMPTMDIWYASLDECCHRLPVRPHRRERRRAGVFLREPVIAGRDGEAGRHPLARHTRTARVSWKSLRSNSSPHTEERNAPEVQPVGIAAQLRAQTGSRGCPSSPRP